MTTLARKRLYPLVLHFRTRGDQTIRAVIKPDCNVEWYQWADERRTQQTDEKDVQPLTLKTLQSNCIRAFSMFTVGLSVSFPVLVYSIYFEPYVPNLIAVACMVGCGLADLGIVYHVTQRVDTQIFERVASKDGVDVDALELIDVKAAMDKEEWEDAFVVSKNDL